MRIKSSRRSRGETLKRVHKLAYKRRLRRGHGDYSGIEKENLLLSLYRLGILPPAYTAVFRSHLLGKYKVKYIAAPRHYGKTLYRKVINHEL